MNNQTFQQRLQLRIQIREEGNLVSPWQWTSSLSELLCHRFLPEVQQLSGQDWESLPIQVV